MSAETFAINKAWDDALAAARAHVSRGGKHFQSVFIGTLAGHFGRSVREIVDAEEKALADHAESVREAAANDERMGRHTP